MRYRAADGASAPRLHITDPWQGRREQRLARRQLLDLFKGVLSNTGADADTPVNGFDLIKIGYLHNVDDDARAGHAHVKHWDQCLAPC